MRRRPREKSWMGECVLRQQSPASRASSRLFPLRGFAESDAPLSIARVPARPYTERNATEPPAAAAFIVQTATELGAAKAPPVTRQRCLARRRPTFWA